MCPLTNAATLHRRPTVSLLLGVNTHSLRPASQAKGSGVGCGSEDKERGEGEEEGEVVENREKANRRGRARAEGGNSGNA
jgi:hypothetical protein